MALLKDPLVFFLAVGAVLLFAGRYWQPDTGSMTINITDHEVRRLTDQWQAQMRRSPTAEELTGLMDAFIREEIYYREAIRLGLDDTIVRRRMVQKLTFLTEDIATTTPPTEAALRRWYEQHPSDFTQPERISFTHRFFSVDTRQDAEADARQALQASAGKGESESESEGERADEGDPFMLPKSYTHRSVSEIGDLFGRAFATALFATRGTGWRGPLRSAYGWHLVRIEARLEASLTPFVDARERVLADLQSAARDTANDDYYASLKSRYTINLPE